jgi:hypothetical protein
VFQFNRSRAVSDRISIEDPPRQRTPRHTARRALNRAGVNLREHLVRIGQNIAYAPGWKRLGASLKKQSHRNFLFNKTSSRLKRCNQTFTALKPTLNV